MRIDINRAANLENLAHLQNRVFNVMKRYKNNEEELKDTFQELFETKFIEKYGFVFEKTSNGTRILQNGTPLSEKTFIFLSIIYMKQLLIGHFKKRNVVIKSKTKENDSVKLYMNFAELNPIDQDGNEFLNLQVANKLLNEYEENDFLEKNKGFKNLHQFLNETKDIKTFKKLLRFHYFNNELLTPKQRESIEKAIFIFSFPKISMEDELFIDFFNSQQNKNYFFKGLFPNLLKDLEYVNV
jgi:hypothetical protein